ncbi:hypothetical protein FSP39_000827 [Pinctada imbricata]|uniref:FAM192A/Fyv6 N-terminal domain-containing protein n=1 Tax=Pinctada imbricata TaxID=66713 RepID=A0AA88XLZ0_PINIB|nr:hypothetical protein FSP39_000827 [Pinctada imbricata]
MTDLSKKFVTQGEIDERRKKRQEEWDRKRAPDDPLECPDEVVDNRSLFERLQEQKDKKEMEFQDSISFKNEIKTLQEDEVQFLNYVSKKEVELTKARNAEEAQIIQEMKISFTFYIRIEPVKGQKEEKKTLTSQIGASQSKKSQQALLAGVVKGRGSHMAAIQNRNNSSTTDANQTTSKASQKDTEGQGPSSSSPAGSMGNNSKVPNNTNGNQTAKIIGVLPGLGAYDNDTSDSATSSSDSECDFRLAPPKKIHLHLGA